MSATDINYIITYDSNLSQYSSIPTGSYLLMNPASPIQVKINSLSFSRNIAPSDDQAEFVLAGLRRIQSAREVYFYRVNAPGSPTTYTLKFRGMTTNPTYHDGPDGQTTTIEVYGLFFELQMRLFQIAGKSPPPLQPNTNPYLVYLNPTLGLRFGQLWAMILVNAFQNNYSTGHLPTIGLNNLTPTGAVNPTMGQFTDFDPTVVNDNMNLQYQNVSATVDRLVTSALFNPQQDQPFLSEYRLDIGDEVTYAFTTLMASVLSGATTISVASATGFSTAVSTGYASGTPVTSITVGLGATDQETAYIQSISGNTITLKSALANNHTLGETIGTPANVYQPTLPTLTVMLFDPAHSMLGNGRNRTGLLMGDGSIFTNPDGTPGSAGNSPNTSNPNASTFYAPMSYVEFGDADGYIPIDTIIFSEGDNFVSVDLAYDWLSMNNSWVLVGGSFLGSDVVALPIDNQRSIAEFGLKQTNQQLNNVVDQGEIQRYVGTSINFFQHPIPNITIHPDYVYASSHTLYPGDYVLINAPSLMGIIEDSNGNTFGGSYNSAGELISYAFTARTKTIAITWDADNGEDITLSFTFPILNVPLGAGWANYFDDTAQYGGAGGAIQFMYTAVLPSDRTVIGRNQQQLAGASFQSGGDFISNKASPLYPDVDDSGSGGQGPGGGTNVIADFKAQAIPMFASVVPNQLSIVQNGDTPSNQKADDVLIYQFTTEIDSATGIASSGGVVSSPTDVWMTVIQPDGMAIFDGILNVNQIGNILTLISKSHSSPPYSGASAPFVNDVSGNYQVIFRNSVANPWVPYQLLSTLPAPTFSGSGATTPGLVQGFIYTAVNATGVEFAMSVPTVIPEGYATQSITWPIAYDQNGNPASSYNLYKFYYGLSSSQIDDIMYLNSNSKGYNFYQNVLYSALPLDVSSLGGTTANTQPFLSEYGLEVEYNGSFLNGSNITAGDQYWYCITALNPEGIESESSQEGTPFYGTNVVAQPSTHQITDGVNQTNGATVSSTATILTDTSQSWQTNQWAGWTLQYTSGPASGNTETIISNTSDTLTTNAFSPAPDATGDTYTILPQQIEIDWPSIPYAAGYNIYRATGSGGNMPARSSFGQIATGVTNTSWTDDGTLSPDGSTTPPDEVETAVSNVSYTAYVNSSFQSDPSYTQSITAQANNPSTVSKYDPTQQRVYLPTRP
jgi:hypothetical protein